MQSYSLLLPIPATRILGLVMFVINVLQFVVRMRLMDFPVVKLCAQALNPKIAVQLITMDSSLMYDATLTA